MGHERRGSESSSGVLPFGLLHVHSNKRKAEGDAAMHDARVVQTIAVSDRGFALEARGQVVVEASWSDVRRVVAWARAQEELAPLEPLIASLARELHVEPLGDWEVKARWPSA